MLATNFCKSFFKKYFQLNCELSNNRSVHVYLLTGFILVVSTVIWQSQKHTVVDITRIIHKHFILLKKPIFDCPLHRKVIFFVYKLSKNYYHNLVKMLLSTPWPWSQNSSHKLDILNQVKARFSMNFKDKSRSISAPNVQKMRFE